METIEELVVYPSNSVYAQLKRRYSNAANSNEEVTNESPTVQRDTIVATMDEMFRPQSVIEDPLGDMMVDILDSADVAEPKMSMKQKLLNSINKAKHSDLGGARQTRSHQLDNGSNSMVNSSLHKSESFNIPAPRPQQATVISSPANQATPPPKSVSMSELLAAEMHITGSSPTSVATKRSRFDSKCRSVELKPVSEMRSNSTACKSTTVVDDTNFESTSGSSVVNSASRHDADSGNRQSRQSSLELLSSELPAALVSPLAMALLVFLLLLCYIVPLPSFFVGFIAGVYVFCISTLWCLLKLLPRVDRPLMKVSELEANELVVDETELDKVVHKVWMNEITQYDSKDYSINKTFSVFVALQGSELTLQRPRQSFSRKSTFDDLSPTNVKFVHSRTFDLKGCEMSILPVGLCKKRLWSRKYPIKVELIKSGIQQRKSNALEKLRSLYPGQCHVAPPVEFVPSSSDSTIANDEDCLDFEMVTKEACNDLELYLFARTSREKEEWYWRFRRAAGSVSLRLGAEYRRFIDKSIPDAVAMVETGLYTKPKTSPAKAKCNPAVTWVNVFLSRILFDFIKQKYWSDFVAAKIQRKLNLIKLPYFIEGISLKDIDLGVVSPLCTNPLPIKTDDRGIWISLDFVYEGSFQMTLETKVNLWRLGSRNANENEVGDLDDPTLSLDDSSDISVPVDKKATFNSEDEDSLESSDEDVHVDDSGSGTTAGWPPKQAKKKILNLVDKITKSKYFQQATENRYVKKAMNEVSNTSLMLTVQAESLRGTLVLNIPPPPTDRVWYGFSKNTKISLNAFPKVGEKAVKFTYITEFIEKKLVEEFQKVLFLPNMDDLVVPILDSGDVYS